MRNVILFSLVAFCFALSTSIHLPQSVHVSEEDLFHNHVLIHQLDFSPKEKESRFKNFQENLQFIRSFRGDGFHVALNKFAHLSREEFQSQYLSKKAKWISKKQAVGAHQNLCPPTLPQSVDYRDRLFPVENQGDMGNSALFASIAAIRDGILVRNGIETPELSQQNLIDCTDFPSPSVYFDWIVKNNGIDTEASYPSTDPTPGTCKFNPATVGARVIWYQQIQNGNETDLACALAAIGPTTVCVDASRTSFQFYAGGVYYEPECSAGQVDHCMEAVGYGTTGGRDYWIVKNSWGPNWGLKGFILMARNKNNNCGITTDADVPAAVAV